LIAPWAVLLALAADPGAAEAQLRVASRLAAERSTSAPAAYEKAVALDPSGPLADDALLELARYYRPPEVVGQAAAIDHARAAAASSALTRLLEAHPRGDRAAEARYLRAMVRLAPLPGRDPGGAREDLIEAAGLSDRAFRARARVALGALDEEGGRYDRAAGSFARVLVEGGADDAVAAASAGFARTMLREGRFGAAAEVLQSAIDRGAKDGSLAALRRLAVAGVKRSLSPAGRWSARATPVPAIAGPKGAALLAALPDGGFVVYDRKAPALQAFDARGSGASAVALADVTALAVDPFGRVHAATAERVVRLDPEGPVTVAQLGDLAPATALAVDAAGAVLVVDRKGERVARFAPGASSWTFLREAKDGRIAAMGLDTGRLVLADERSGTLMAVAPGLAVSPIGSTVFRKPASVAVDAAGQIAVLDVKQESVTLLDPGGKPRDVLSTTAMGVERPAALAFSPDGTLLVLDAASGRVARVP
jgi:hypothetical protein